MQGFNLIREAWIPVRHRGGRISMRAPHELFGDLDDPVVAIASPRCDLDGGIVQLLIGLLQVALAPADDREWERYASDPPDAATLLSRLEPFAEAFELLGPGPRFYQDPSVAAYGGESISIEKLLVDLSVGEGGGDLFARNGSVGQICFPCSAAALASLQASAPAGGRGNMTSLRGGGPLTTLVVPAAATAPLWNTLWLNVVPLRRLAPDGDTEVGPASAIFPWLRTPKIEPQQAPKISPEDVSHLQVFFGMPRRIWLGTPEAGECGLCGRMGSSIAQFQSRPNGNSYTGAWRHPLSPYRRFKDEQMLAVKGDDRGIGYRHWLGLVVALPGGDIQPALPVALLATQYRSRGKLVGGEARLWAFGYAMDNMKAVAWSEGQMPVYELEPQLAADYAAIIGQLVGAAQQAELAVRRAFKSLVARRSQDVKRDPEQIVARFWQDTETPFYIHAERIRRGMATGSLPGANTSTDPTADLTADPTADPAAAALLAERDSWHKTLCARAKEIFDTEVGAADFRAIAPKQVAEAWKELQQTLHGKKLKTTLGLPVAEDKKKKGGRK